eukprot:NODE_3601_length_1191_cov_118.355805_g3420_i0.p1 GENE.NODE_3601_length_1191_cov_118.355805_g3420_i0~~NODE_3601_length_1191_cov_118.355805_g3420_i0.p1  ORF type:complete len:370 (-),score=55.77 NODE_3601_length_1191_cov_118.355805_g3420_i0:82-1122(-)
MQKCAECGQTGSGLQRCGGCKQVVYCNPDHQRAHWKAGHKAECKRLAAATKSGVPSKSPSVPGLDEANIESGQYMGTLRWAADTVFPALPAFPSPAPPLDEGWKQYCPHRLSPGGKGDVTLQPQMLDGLSFPLTLVWTLRQMLLGGHLDKGLIMGKQRTVHVLIAGAARRAEERILRASNYFQELGHYLPSLRFQLHFVGPEMSDENSEPIALCPTVTGRCIKGKCLPTLEKLVALLDQSRGDPVPPAILLCGFNTGFASGDAQLQADWKADLEYILRYRIPAIFTCTNEDDDLANEMRQWDQLNAHVCFPPRQSPFHALSATQTPDGKHQYCANCWVYAIHGTKT